MRVLQLGPFPPPEGGISRNMLSIREDLLRQGDECAIIATAKSTKESNDRQVFHPRSAFGLMRLLATLDYDVLHLHVGGEITKKVLALVAACAFFGRGKSVLSIHSGGYPSSKAGRSARRNSVRGFIFRRFQRIVAVNPLIAEVFEKYGVAPEKLRVVHPFVHQNPDSAVKMPQELTEFVERCDSFLLSVCLLEETYDLFMQIDAMEKILERFPGAGLMIVGSGSLEQELKKRAASKNYAKRIFLTGDVAHPVTLHLINRADALLRTTFFDGDAIAVREALHLGTPVIATDNGLRPDGVRLISMRDREAFVRAIEDVLNRKNGSKPRQPDDRSNVEKIITIYREISE